MKSHSSGEILKSTTNSSRPDHIPYWRSDTCNSTDLPELMQLNSIQQPDKCHHFICKLSTANTRNYPENDKCFSLNPVSHDLQGRIKCHRVTSAVSSTKELRFRQKKLQKHVSLARQVSKDWNTKVLREWLYHDQKDDYIFLQQDREACNCNAGFNQINHFPADLNDSKQNIKKGLHSSKKTCTPKPRKIPLSCVTSQPNVQVTLEDNAQTDVHV